MEQIRVNGGLVTAEVSFGADGGRPRRANRVRLGLLLSLPTFRGLASQGAY